MNSLSSSESAIYSPPFCQQVGGADECCLATGTAHKQGCRFEERPHLAVDLLAQPADPAERKRGYPGPERRSNPPSNPFGQPGPYRLVTRIGRPPCGCVVSFWTGHGLVAATQSKRKRDSRTAREMTASCMAKLMPMQTRGPAPNGRY